MRTLTYSLNSRVVVLFAGLLAGATLSACTGPKTIGEETATEASTGGSEDTGVTSNIGEVCEDGDMKPAPDGCNTCTCSDGSWACTEKACDDEGPAPVCEDGDEMPAPDGCNTCTCSMGQWACTEIGCPATETAGDESSGTGGSTTTGVGDTTGPAGVCGDGVVDGEEQCDDGNLVDGDGCSSACEAEGGVCQGKPMDPLTIVDAKIAGDTLLVDVEYGGGCETHDIDYCWDGSFAESDPVQTWIDLWHDSHDDPCDAIVQEQRVLDLTAMKTAWQEGYQQQSGTIIIHLGGWDTSLDYTF